MTLENVRLEADSLAEAWGEIGQRLLLRTVLFSPAKDAWSRAPFSFTAQRCRGSELLDALVRTYPNMTWTQDAAYGVIWIHPRDMPYERILETKVEVGSDQLGVPMLDGVLESLARVPGGSLDTEWYNEGFRNTYNHPVDLLSGTYAIRDVLNICCTSGPTITLCVQAGMVRRDLLGRKLDATAAAGEYTLLQAVNLVYIEYNRNAPRPTPGALAIWRVGIGPVDDTGPAAETICQKLADPNPAVRASARDYYRAELYRYPLRKAASGLRDNQTEAWVWLTKSEVLIRMEGLPFDDAVARLRVLATDQALLTWPSDLAVLVGMELARLGHDTHYLDVVARREFKPGELAGVRSRIHALARLSPEIREKLRGGLGERLAAADPSFLKAGDVRPNPPRSLQGLSEAPPVIEFKLQPAQTQPEP